MCVDVSWCVSMHVDVCIYMLMCVYVCWCLLMFVEACRCMHMYVDVCVYICICMLMCVYGCWCVCNFDVYWATSSSVDVRWCTFAFVGVSWCVPMYVDPSRDTSVCGGVWYMILMSLMLMSFVSVHTYYIIPPLQHVHLVYIQTIQQFVQEIPRNSILYVHSTCVNVHEWFNVHVCTYLK